MNPRLVIVGSDGRPTRQFLPLIPGLRPQTVISRKGMATVDLQNAFQAAFGEALPPIRVEVDGIATRDFRNRLLAVS